MATLEVREVFRLPSRRQFVIAGKLLDGTIESGMHALIWLDGQAFWRIGVKGVEFIDRFVAKESLLGLVCDESNVEDAETCHTLAPLGTVIEVAA